MESDPTENGCEWVEEPVHVSGADRIITDMSPTALRRQIGQLLIVGFNGHQITPELRSMAREFGLGGVILFARNIAEPEQVAEVAHDAARMQPGLPAWVSVDQ